MKTLLPVLCVLLGGCFDSFVRPNPGCKANADCASGLCLDVEYFKGELGPGACVPEDKVIYVDGSRCEKSSGGQGTRSVPYCEVQTAITLALASATDGNRYISLGASEYSHKNVNISIREGTTLAIIGAWADPKLKGTNWDTILGSNVSQIRAEENDGKAAIALTGGGRLIIDGVEITTPESGGCKNTTHTIRIESSAELHLRRTRVMAPCGFGIITNPFPERAKLYVYRSLFFNNKDGGINAWNVTGLRVINSLFMGPGQGIDSSSNYPYNGFVDFSTFVGNSITTMDTIPTGTGSAVSCRSNNALMNIRIRSSILIDSALPQQNCNNDKIKSDFTLESTKGNQMQLYPQFENPYPVEKPVDFKAANYKLKAVGGNAACCLDKAKDGVVDPEFAAEYGLDFFGNPRPLGMGADIGFHEAM